MSNSAINLLHAIGGTAAGMIVFKKEQEDIKAFLKQDAKDSPPVKRAPKLARQYQKRYGS